MVCYLCRVTDQIHSTVFLLSMMICTCNEACPKGGIYEPCFPLYPSGRENIPAGPILGGIYVGVDW